VSAADTAPQALRVGVHLFNAGEYFEQHEVLEDLWRAEQGPIRELYQGILQVGVGLYHLERGNYHGATTLLDRGLARLGTVEQGAHGIDVAGLVLQARWVRRQLDELGQRRMAEIDRARFPKIGFLPG
jgi:predicted metal-dependent hydrolase